MKTILIIGATGFVGSHTLRYLLDKPGIKLVVACRDRTRLNVDFTGEVRQGDIRDKEYLKTLFEDVDVVVNAASWSSLWGNKQRSDELFLRPSLMLINAFEQSRASTLVNVSSTSVAAPDDSADAMSQGIYRTFWPHFSNVITIENGLRKLAAVDKCVMNMRLGLFAGENYGLGLLPILVPRMKTHLVPWVAGGKTEMPIIDGRDIGQAMGLAALKNGLTGYNSFNVVGKSIPTVREVISFIADEYNLPRPHFSVPFSIAYPFAWFMEFIDKVVPWEPLIVRSIILLLENTHTNNSRVTEVLGYQAEYDWQMAIRAQMDEMLIKQKVPMRMARPIA